MLIDENTILLASQAPYLTVSSLAFNYVKLAKIYQQNANYWHEESWDYLIIESLFHLSRLARLERVHPQYANMQVQQWARSPSHAQCLLWYSQLNNAVKKVLATSRLKH